MALESVQHALMRHAFTWQLFHLNRINNHRRFGQSSLTQWLQFILPLPTEEPQYQICQEAFSRVPLICLFNPEPAGWLFTCEVTYNHIIKDKERQLNGQNASWVSMRMRVQIPAPTEKSEHPWEAEAGLKTQTCIGSRAQSAQGQHKLNRL